MEEKSQNFFSLSVQKHCKEKERAEKNGTCKVLCIFWGWCLNGQREVLSQVKLALQYSSDILKDVSSNDNKFAIN